MSLETIVVVNISKDTKAPTQKGFGIPIILSKEAALLPVFAVIRVKEYEIATILADLITDGFAIADETFKAAQAFTQQSPRVEKVKVIRQAASVAQVTTFTIEVIENETTYTTTINGIPHIFLSDIDATDEEIRDGLIASIIAGIQPVTPVLLTSSTYKVTADVAGEGFSQAVDDNQSFIATTPSVGPVDEIIAARDEDDDWYFITQAPANTNETKLIATYSETQIKLFGYQTDDADSKDAAELLDADNLMQFLKDKNYDRTFGAWIPTTDLGEYKTAGWIGLMAPKDPGAATWKFKEAAGITADSFTTAEKKNIQDKNGNTYTLVAGFNIFEEGVSASGEFIDIVRGIDWMVARIQENVFGLFAGEDKIPYDDGGIEAIGLRIDEIGALAVRRGIIVAGTFLVTLPLRVDTSKVDRVDRLLRNVKFSGDLAGAIHGAKIDGTVTV